MLHVHLQNQVLAALALRNLRHVLPFLSQSKIVAFLVANPVICRLTTVLPLDWHPACQSADFALDDSHSSTVLKAPLPIRSSDNSCFWPSQTPGNRLITCVNLAQHSDQIAQLAHHLQVTFPLLSNSIRPTFPSEIPEHCCSSFAVDVDNDAFCPSVFVPGCPVRSSPDADPSTSKGCVHQAPPLDWYTGGRQHRRHQLPTVRTESSADRQHFMAFD
mmetsp:Transcript_79202/g.181313  ORF Transcript_79202/g.181313 Transcript_79202/m.181313 type:complete len:217 (+) Transcript_79202:1251-1901(+)